MSGATAWSVGAATVDITPRAPLRLAGFATRTTPFEGVAEPIYLSATALSQTEPAVAGDAEGGAAVDDAILLIGADLLWWAPSTLPRVRRAIAEATGLDAMRIVCTATHNHSGPPTGSDFVDILETPDEAYIDFLIAAAVEGAQRALAARRPAKLVVQRGELGLGVYRRVQRDGQIEMEPNYAVPVDRRLSVLRFVDATSGATQVGLIHYTCHANVAASNEVFGDYPGAAIAQLREAEPGTHWLFLQGTAADIRPNVVIGDRFDKSDPARCRRFAARLSETVTALQADGDQPAGVPALGLWRDAVALPLDAPMGRAELKAERRDPDPVRRDRAQRLLARLDADPDYGIRHLALCLIRLTAAEALLICSAEMVQAYGHYIRMAGRLYGLELLPVSCSEGMIGYLCSAEQMAEGGYEPQGSALYFALEGVYGPATEARIHDGIDALLARALGPVTDGAGDVAERSEHD